MIVQFTDFDLETMLSVTMDNEEEEILLLMRIMTENNATIQRYYWTSKFSGEIEYINPLIYDAYDFHIDFIGSRPDLKICLEIYKDEVKVIRSLPKLRYNFTENDIVHYAYEILRNL